MKTFSAKDKSTNFEAWARLLICRKVPDGYQHLINSEVVRAGAEILKDGEAFEVRVDSTAKAMSDAPMNLLDTRIIVTAFPPALEPGNFSRMESSPR